MSSELAIKVQALKKCYQIYDKPRDRLKQFILPKFQKLVGLPPKKYYREFWALRGVSFEVKKGETVGIVGRNGSGKSTILQIICGTLNSTSGTIETRGRIAALLELGSGFNPDFTGRENVYLNAAVLGLRKEEIDLRFNDIASFADIGDFIEQPVKTYSSGMMVRLAFAVAINVEPDILIIDEALAVGDELFQRKCFSRIEAIRENGATIVFVSHSGGQIVELCDRAIFMDRGESLAVGTPKQIIGFYQQLIYAPADKQELMRDQIQRLIDGEGAQLLAKEMMQHHIPQYQSKATLFQDNYDPGMMPGTVIEYASNGAHIGEPEIIAEDGRRVNILIRGRMYRYRYNVTFLRNARNVRFGMLVKTTSGLELGGSTTAQSTSSSIDNIDSNVTYQIDFRFRCSLTAGVYFMNAGVMGDVDGNLTFLHRLVDAAMFRVQAEQNCLVTGIVDFECRHDIKSM